MIMIPKKRVGIKEPDEIYDNEKFPITANVQTSSTPQEITN